MIILNYDVIDAISKHGNMAQHEQLDTFLMQWFSSSDGLKSLLLDILVQIYNEVQSCKM